MQVHLEALAVQAQRIGDPPAIDDERARPLEQDVAGCLLHPRGGQRRDPVDIGGEDVVVELLDAHRRVAGKAVNMVAGHPNVDVRAGQRTARLPRRLVGRPADGLHRALLVDDHTLAQTDRGRQA